MIAQSLGGMEIVVGMSSFTGGLVLDKSELIQGSELPINYLFASTPMPLTSNVYHIGQGINTISRHDRHDHASSCIDSCEPYPALCTLVERSEGVSRDANELDEWYHSNALFGFAIAAHSDRVVRMGRLEQDVVLNRILSMGNLQLEGHGQAVRWKLSSDVHPICCGVGESASSKDRARR